MDKLYEEVEDITFKDVKHKCAHMIIIRKQQLQHQGQGDPKNMMDIQKTFKRLE